MVDDYLQVSFETSSCTNVFRLKVVCSRGWLILSLSLLLSHTHTEYFFSSCLILDANICFAEKLAILNIAAVKFRRSGSTFSLRETPTARPLQTTALPPSDRKPMTKPPSALPSCGRADRTQPESSSFSQLWMSGTHTSTRGHRWMSRMYMPCNVHGKVKLYHPEWLRMCDMCESSNRSFLYTLFFYYVAHQIDWSRNYFWMILAWFMLFHAEKERIQSICEKELGFSLSVEFMCTSIFWNTSRLRRVTDTVHVNGLLSS